MTFDASYQPRCWTCGGSRVQEPREQPPLPVPGAPLPTSASTYQRWRAGDFLEIQRSREVQRRNLIIIVSVALAFAGVIILVLLTTDFDDDPGALQAPRASHRSLDVTVWSAPDPAIRGTLASFHQVDADRSCCEDHTHG